MEPQCARYPMTRRLAWFYRVAARSEATRRIRARIVVGVSTRLGSRNLHWRYQCRYYRWQCAGTYPQAEDEIMASVSRLILFAAIAAIGVFAAVVCFEKPAAAQNSPWCAYYDLGEGGATNCGFSTYQQCLATVSGAGASCGPNPQYQGVSGPAPSRRVRRHSY